MKRGWKTWVWILVALGAVATARADLAYDPPLRLSPGMEYRVIGGGLWLCGERLAWVVDVFCLLPVAGLVLLARRTHLRDGWMKLALVFIGTLFLVRLVKGGLEWKGTGGLGWLAWWGIGLVAFAGVGLPVFFAGRRVRWLKVADWTVWVLGGLALLALGNAIGGYFASGSGKVWPEKEVYGVLLLVAAWALCVMVLAIVVGGIARLHRGLATMDADAKNALGGKILLFSFALGVLFYHWAGKIADCPWRECWGAWVGVAVAVPAGIAVFSAWSGWKRRAAAALVLALGCGAWVVHGAAERRLERLQREYREERRAAEEKHEEERRRQYADRMRMLDYRLKSEAARAVPKSLQEGDVPQPDGLPDGDAISTLSNPGENAR